MKGFNLFSFHEVQHPLGHREWVMVSNRQRIVRDDRVASSLRLHQERLGSLYYL